MIINYLIYYFLQLIWFIIKLLYLFANLFVYNESLKKKKIISNDKVKFNEKVIIYVNDKKIEKDDLELIRWLSIKILFHPPIKITIAIYPLNHNPTPNNLTNSHPKILIQILIPKLTKKPHPFPTNPSTKPIKPTCFSKTNQRKS